MLIFIKLVIGQLEHKIQKYFLIFSLCSFTASAFFKNCNSKKPQTTQPLNSFILYLSALSVISKCGYFLQPLCPILSSHIAVRAACLSSVASSRQISICSFIFPNGCNVWNKQCLCILMCSLLDLEKTKHWGAMKTWGSW